MNDNEKVIKYSTVKSFMQPFWTIFDYLKTFAVQGFFFSLIMVLLSNIFNQKYVCVFNQEIAQSNYCINSTYLYIPYLFIKLVVMAIFINMWYATVYKKETIDKTYFQSAWKKFLKTFGFMIIFLIFNLLPLLSAMILIFRIPNPNWKIELLYFTVVSTGFLFPFVLMRFYSIFSLFLDGKNWKEFKNIWCKTSGYTMKIVLSCILMFFIDLILLVLTSEILSNSHGMPIWLYNMYAEIIFSYMNYFIVLSLINLFEVQKKTFLE